VKNENTSELLGLFIIAATFVKGPQAEYKRIKRK
jgi:hypothetical protein